MCGGTLEINNNETVATCEYCGTQQSIPKLDDERRMNLYDRANHFRRNSEFDKAIGIYEQILDEDNTDAEAYWSLVLCRYGIEYVEDTVSHKRIPTVNRTQFTSVFDDDNYKSALKYADDQQRKIYEKEAKVINEIQKDILAISQKEESFDVFICYKETDDSGRRTPDSVLANDLYHQLTQEGFKVFFSRITLEDKLGSAYEPFIFAALNSAKVMVVIGTRPEFFKAVWVRNEWSRYLTLIKQGQKKMLIPAYKDMDPYDLPEEFSHLQAQDMSKLGFMQDLIRAVKKMVVPNEAKTTVVKETIISPGNVSTVSLLKRAFMFLEDGEWNSADEYCEKILDIEPENALAYLGKLMSELKIRKQEDLKNCLESFEGYSNYQKVLRFADEKLKTVLAGYIEEIKIRNENTIYNRAKDAMALASTEYAYIEAAHLFETISEYMDSVTLAQECYDKAEIARKDAILTEGKEKMNSEFASNYEVAIKLFESIPGWRDADEKVHICKQMIEEIKAREEADRLQRERQADISSKEAEKRAKRNKKIAILTMPIVFALVIFIIVLFNTSAADKEYSIENSAVIELKAAREYMKVSSMIETLDVYQVAIRRNLQVGDIYNFGSYEQDNDPSNGQEEIEWLVIAKEKERILVVSRYALDCKPYNTEDADVTWETSSLRSWLNNDFINTAFSDEEKEWIPTVTVPADENPEWDYFTDSGNATQDKVFLLSIAEANKYFDSDSERQCKSTNYVAANGVTENHSGFCVWWLRTPGADQDRVACVYYGGGIDMQGPSAQHNAGSTDPAVRPALWIDLYS